MNEYTKFREKLKKKYAYAYSLVPEHMWRWIYDNLIKNRKSL
jgi:hypothetical protein